MEPMISAEQAGRVAGAHQKMLFVPTPPSLEYVLLSDLPDSDTFLAAPPERAFVESVRAQGVLQPVSLIRLPSGGYQVAAGRRRIMAARLAGLVEIPAVVNEAGFINRANVTVTENAQRSQNLLAEIEAVRHLRERDGLTDAQLTQNTGIPQQRLHLLARIESLPAEILEAYRTGRISESALLRCARLSDTAQASLAQKVQSDPQKRITGDDVREASLMQRQAAAASLPDRLFDLDIPQEPWQAQVRPLLEQALARIPDVQKALKNRTRRLLEALPS